MTPTPPEVVPAQVGGVVVTQADISAAKPIIIRVMIDELTTEDLHEAFARHRLATIEECAKVADRGYSSYEKRAKNRALTRNERTRCSHYAQALSELATAIRHLSAPPPPPVDVGEGEDG